MSRETFEKTACDDDELAVKSFFLGPGAENGDWLKQQLEILLGDWFEGRRRLSLRDGSVIPLEETGLSRYRERQDAVAAKARALSSRFGHELPKFSPRYLGHMFSDLSLPALLGHWVALLHNPNNISREASLVGLEIEREAIAMLATMFGYDPARCAGHFTSGGTIANFEAFLRARARQRLWIALGCYLHRTTGRGPTLLEASRLGWAFFDDHLRDKTRRDDFSAWADKLMYEENFVATVEEAYGEKWRAPAMILSAGAHYSWLKAADFFGLPREAVVSVPLDDAGRLCVRSLHDALDRLANEKRPLQMVVTLAGSTEFGSVDPIGTIQGVLDGFAPDGSIWHHVDAAFGGFFASIDATADTALAPEIGSAFHAIRSSTSVTVDPHKLGYVPYASGVFLCRDRRDYPHHKVHAPYVDFVADHDPGLYTIEGSRAATGAAATWLTGHSIGFDHDGYGRILSRTLLAKRRLADKLRAVLGEAVLIPPGLDLNILCFCLRPGKTLSSMNKETRHLFTLSGRTELRGYSISQTTIALDRDHGFLAKWLDEKGVERDDVSIVFARLCLMNPFVTSRHGAVSFLEDFASAVSAVMEKNG